MFQEHLLGMKTQTSNCSPDTYISNSGNKNSKYPQDLPNSDASFLRTKYCNQDQKVSYGFACVTESQDMYSSLQSIQLQDFDNIREIKAGQSPNGNSYCGKNPLTSYPVFIKNNNKSENVVYSNNCQSQRRNDLSKTANTLKNNLLTQPTKLGENKSSRRIVQNSERNISHSPYKIVRTYKENSNGTQNNKFFQNLNVTPTRTKASEKTYTQNLNATPTRTRISEKTYTQNLNATPTRTLAPENTKTYIQNLNATPTRILAPENTKTYIQNLKATPKRILAPENTKTYIQNLTPTRNKASEKTYIVRSGISQNRSREPMPDTNQYLTVKSELCQNRSRERIPSTNQCLTVRTEPCQNRSQERIIHSSRQYDSNSNIPPTYTKDNSNLMTYHKVSNISNCTYNTEPITNSHFISNVYPDSTI